MRAALLAAAILFAGNGLGRLIGVLLASSMDSYNASALGFELVFAAAASTLLRSAPSGGP